MTKKTIIRFLGMALMLQVFLACSPDDYTYHDNSVMSIEDIDHIELIANQRMLLADGRAQLELYPRLFTKDNYLIPDERIQNDWLEYTSESGIALQRYFSTSDASLIGKTITAKLKIKGTQLESNSVSFQVVEPLNRQYTSEIRIPVVFHIIQTTEDIESFGGAYKQEQIEQVLRKLNYMFSGETTQNPIGVDTHIRLVLAGYDPDGSRMMEPGINRFTTKEIDATNNYEDFLAEHHLIWPAGQYMNIWLISDRGNVSGTFSKVSNRCMPQYVPADAQGMPEGIEWKEYQDEPLLAKDLGVLYKLQELDKIDRNFKVSEYEPGYNEIGYYIGRYLGLLSTCNYMNDEIGTDYCDDTLNYIRDESKPGRNETWYKESEGCYFRAENIMDDPTGGHCSISRDQCMRMRWVLNNCVGRSAWKSDFAFEGK
ncbi:hypothetical protein [Bacteroides acidifaciens]|uniref:hypothetical protein n=1 Tax=Bacteroides acidifaciens TaxID=85831 RepID=UPI0030151CC3